MIRKEAWSFYRTRCGVRLWWEFQKPKGPKGSRGLPSALEGWILEICKQRFSSDPFYGRDPYYDPLYDEK